MSSPVESPPGEVVPAHVIRVRDEHGRPGPRLPALPPLAAVPAAGLGLGWQVGREVSRGIGSGVGHVHGRATGLLRAVTAPLRRRRPAISLPRDQVRLRCHGADASAEQVVAASAGRRRIVVFVPPPGGDERGWRSGREYTGAGYDERLRDLLDWAPVTVALPDPVSVAHAAVELSALMQRLVDAWASPPERIAVIGAGTGAVVARTAAGLLVEQDGGGQAWANLLTDVIALDAPPYAVSDAPLTRGARHAEEQWAGIVAMPEAVLAVPPAPGVRYVLVEPGRTGRASRIGRRLGDLLWWRQRARGRLRQAKELFPTAERYRVAGNGSLLNHPDVHDALLRWLA